MGTYASGEARSRPRLDLEESEERLRAIADRLPTLLAYIDSDQRYRYNNATYAAWFGTTPDQLQGREVRDVLGEATYSAVSAHLEEALAGRGSEFEVTISGDLGAQRDVAAKVVPDFGDSGEVIGLFVLVQDISQRKQAERALRQSEERLRRLVESTSAIPWEAEAGSREFVYIGPQAVRVLGYPLERWYEPGFWERHLHPEDREEALELFQQRSRSCRDFDFEYRMLKEDGGVVWLHDLVSVELVDGEPASLRGFLVDTSARKQTELQVGERLGFEQLVAEISASLVCRQQEEMEPWLDRGLRLLGEHLRVDRVFVNGRWGEQDALERPRVWVADGSEGYPTRALEDGLAHYRSRMMSGVGLVFSSPDELPESAKSERRWIERAGIRSAAIVPLLAGGEVIGSLGIESLQSARAWSDDTVERLRVVAAIFADALVQRASEEARRQLNDRLLRRHEEERRQLARELHEDLCQRLAALAIETDLLRQQDGIDSGRQQGLSRLYEQLSKITTDLRQISYALRPAALEQLGLEHALRRYCHDFGERTGIASEFTLEGDAALVPSELAVGLFRVAQECLLNVAQHSRAKAATVTLSASERRIRLQVHDNGIGFCRPQLAGRQHLGLLGMEERVRAMGGEFAVRSVPGEGAEVSVEIPLA